MNSKLPIRKLQKGTITPALLAISGAFMVVIYALLFILSIQFDYSNRQVLTEEALHIAETGVNYYRWHLAHDPGDYQDGTGGPGPYEHEYVDPQGEAVGKYSLEITAPSAGSSVVTIKSTGWTYSNPKIKRVITVQYGQPSFTTYSFLQNSSSWYGSGITVNGPIHSNNGIRMDGTNLSLVTSAKETYTCGSETGCSPPQQKPGVWGSGGDSGLWQFPVPPIDFDAVSVDLVDMRDAAQTEGLYLGTSGSQGYHIVLNQTTFNVYRVTSTGYYSGYAVDDGCQRRYQRINNETLIGTYNITDTPILFAEDYLWVEGELDGRMTIVAARFPIDSNAMNIWIPDNITYTTYDDAHALGLIAQNDIYYTKDIPNDFKIDAALMAQKGKIIRHGYFSWCGGSSGAVKDKLTIYGVVISYEKSYWNFGSGPSSGFHEREINYQPSLLYFPPPYYPTSGEYEFISWKEE
jgi:hypothetical protein